MTIHDFRQLRELEFVVTQPSPLHEALLSSITSIELRKVVFLIWDIHDWKIFAQRTKEWALIDKQSCRLVDRLRTAGYRHTLEAELQLREVGGDPEAYEFTAFLPEFIEKGLVTVVDATHIR